jgi:hypothetical protein
MFQPAATYQFKDTPLVGDFVVDCDLPEYLAYVRELNAARLRAESRERANVPGRNVTQKREWIW